MFHKVKAVTPLPEFKLCVQFCEGVNKIYDFMPLISEWDMFAVLNDKPEIFNEVEVAVGGCGIIWGDALDISCDELWANGINAHDANQQQINDHNAPETHLLPG